MWKKIAKGQKNERKRAVEETNELGGKLDTENKCSEN